MDSSFSVAAIACVGTILYLLYKKFRSSPQYKELAPSSHERNVFSSSHERDVGSFFRHLLEAFDRKGINLFIELTRSNSIVPELRDIIRGSRIGIVMLSYDYVSSTGCLDELVEIIKCREDFGQVVIPIFYELDPSHVEKQTGNFWSVFTKTCEGKTKEDTERWRQALSTVATIDGHLYDSSMWDKEEFMVEEITTHISDILNNSTQSNEFKGLNGMKGNMESLGSDEAIGDTDKERLKRQILDSHIRHIEGMRESIIKRELEMRHELAIITRDSKKIPYTKKKSERAFKDTVYIYCGDYLQYSFASHLSRNFRHKCIDAFVSCNETLDVIEGASATVMIFSKSCLSSILCLDKLMKVFQWQRSRMVVPVFYGVSPSDVVVLEHKSADRIKVWNKAIQEMRELPAHHSREKCTDCELVDEIVKDVYEKLFPTEQIGINSRLLEIEQLLCKQPWGIRGIGIWGMPGIGKTTLAKAFFDQISRRYEASCFIEHFDKAFHEKGLHRLLDEHFGNFFKELPGDCSSITRPSLPSDKLSKKRTLVVLDDVHNPLVAESFLKGFHWFGQGSLIIITSRDKQVFRLCQINHVYEVSSLNENEAPQLFSQCVGKDIREQVLELSIDVIDYANGNPSILSFYSKELKGKNLSEMKDLLGTPYKIPDLFNLLKSSYETLNDSERNIFLDIVCFFVGEDVDYVLQLLEGCVFFPHVGIDVLVEKCLVTISENKVKMHRIIQDVGREIVLIERPRRLWERRIIKSLLEDGKLEANGDPKATSSPALGTRDIEAIYLKTSDFLFDVNPTAFENMFNLRLLKIYSPNSENPYGLSLPKGLDSLPCELRLLHWEKYPLQSFPQDFDPCHLVELNMPHSQLRKLWGGTKNLEMLKIATLSHSQQLSEVGDICKAEKIEQINLEGCTSLQIFPVTGHLQHLRVINLSGCIEIKSLPEISLNIEGLYLQETGIKGLLISNGNVTNLKKVYLTRCTSLGELPASIGNATNLEILHLGHCSRLMELPSSIGNATNLQELNLEYCSSLVEIPSSLGNGTNLENLSLTGCSSLVELPYSIKNSSRLTSIDLDEENNLQVITFGDKSGSRCMEVRRARRGNFHVLTGKQNDEHSMTLGLSVVDENYGYWRTIHFMFYLESDTTSKLASKMVEKAEFMDQDVTFIAEMIDTLLVSMIPTWKIDVTVGHLTHSQNSISYQKAEEATRSVTLVEEERLSQELEEIDAKYREEMKDIARKRKEAIMETDRKLSLVKKGKSKSITTKSQKGKESKSLKEKTTTPERRAMQGAQQAAKAAAKGKGSRRAEDSGRAKPGKTAKQHNKEGLPVTSCDSVLGKGAEDVCLPQTQMQYDDKSRKEKAKKPLVVEEQT